MPAADRSFGHLVHCFCIVRALHRVWRGLRARSLSCTEYRCHCRVRVQMGVEGAYLYYNVSYVGIYSETAFGPTIGCLNPIRSDTNTEYGGRQQVKVRLMYQ